MHHRIVFADKQLFAGWPANNGVWIWDGQEILVGCSTGAYIKQIGHNIQDPVGSILVRSLDGGESWCVETPVNFLPQIGDLHTLLNPIQFTSDGFLMRVIGTGYHGVNEGRGGFYFSLDRGHQWSGPYRFAGLENIPALTNLELTPRTDVIVNGPFDCLVMLSARDSSRWGSDRVFCAQTQDGGLSFAFLNWVVDSQDPSRAVMPSTVRCSSTKLVSAIRRRGTESDQCWIDAFESNNNGQDWKFLSRVGETGVWNGNPPALARLSDGRLCCGYGCRSRRQMLARYSRDDGQTWDSEIVLRDDFSRLEDEADFGYPRLVQRRDGQMVAMYYWATDDHPEQHIAATIWDPGNPLFNTIQD